MSHSSVQMITVALVASVIVNLARAGTPATSKLFEARVDPVSGVVSYALLHGAPDDNRQSLYFITKSMTEDGRFLLFYYTKGNERKGRGPRILMVADLQKDEVRELGDPGMTPFVDCKKDYIVYGRLKHNPGFYRQNLDDPGHETKLCDIPHALTEIGRVRYLASHLTLTRNREKAFLDASVIAPNGATNYVQGLVTLASGEFESWGTTDFYCNHGQLNPVRDDLALCAWEEAWLAQGQAYMKNTGWYPRMWLVEPGGKRTLVPRDRPSRLHPDPHPHFVMNGRYVVCTANNADGHMDLYVTPVSQLVKLTSPKENRQ